MNDVTNINEAFLISRINEVEALILQLRREVREINSSDTDSLPQQQYFTLKDAILLKYGKNYPYTTASTNYALMPCGNTNFKIFSGKKMWPREEILEWLKISDSDIPEYLMRYNVPLTGRIGAKYKKYIKKEDSV